MKNLFYLFVLLFVWVSCKPEDVSLNKSESTISPESVLLKYSNFFGQETDGVIRLAESSNLYSQNAQERWASFLSYFKGENYRYIHFADEIKMNELSFFPRTEDNVAEALKSKDIAKLYGNDISCKIIKAGKTYSKNIYLPQPIKIEVPVLTTDNMVAELEIGTQIKWNIDSQNKSGVVIVLRYVPEVSDKATAQKFPNNIERFIGVEDTEGTYTLKAKDIEGLPKEKGAMVEIVVGRVGFDLFNIPEANKTISLYGYTLVSANVQIK